MLLNIFLFATYLGVYLSILTKLVEQSVFAYLILFALAGLLLLRSANLLTDSILKIAHYLKWREFVVAFFVMSIGGSLPNLFVGLFSAFQGIPELSFGDVVGNNVIDLTLVAALAALIGSELTAESKLAQTSSLLTAIVAILPLFLILDGQLGRGDGIVLLLIFVFYSRWLLSKRQLYPQETQNNGEQQPIARFRTFLYSGTIVVFSIAMLLLSADGAVRTAIFFADLFKLPIVMIGILVIGLGSALPEIYFTIAAARKKQNWVILGELMGAITVLSTLVLGIVALVNPIEIENFSPYAIARFVLILSAFFFFLFLRTHKRLTRKEALVLIALYVAFVAGEILAHSELFIFPEILTGGRV